MIRTVSTVPACAKSSRRSSSVAWNERLPTNSLAAIARPSWHSRKRLKKGRLLDTLPRDTDRLVTGGDTCQGNPLAGQEPSEIDATGRPAVHRDADPGEERRARGGEEADEIRDVLRARDPLERVRRHRLRAILLDRLPSRRGL